MKPLYPLLLALAALFSVCCATKQQHDLSDFTVEVYTPAYASNFDIRGTGDDSSTLITIRNPWQGAGDARQQLLVLRNGAQAPDGFTGQTVKAPVHHVVCMSSSHVAMFDAVGQIRRVAGVSGIDYITNAHINAHRQCGEVRDVGYDTNINFELLASMRPDIVLLYGVTGESTIITGKLRELGLPYVYVGDYTEESPLGKAEWLMLAAELCDCRQPGKALFDGIAGRYNALKAQIAEQAAPRPKVMLNTPYRDTWFMPSSRSYMIRLIEDAGGEYIYKQNNSDTSVSVDLEQAYLLANAADVWINLGSCNSLAELTAQNPKFADIPAIESRRVWNNNRRQTPAGGSDFWESGVMRPDMVLSDLRAIFTASGDSTHYYKQLN